METLLQKFNIAAQRLASEADQDHFVRAALEALAEFGHSNRVELLSLEEDYDALILLGLLTGG